MRVLALVVAFALAACGIDGPPSAPGNANPKVAERGAELLGGDGDI